MAIYQREQQLTNLIQNPTRQPDCWSVPYPEFCTSKKPELLGNNSISVSNSRMPTFEFPWNLAVANNTTLSSLPTTPNISIRNFSLEQLTSMNDDMRYLSFTERLPSTTAVQQFALHTHLSKYSSFLYYFMNYRLIYLTFSLNSENGND